MARHAPAWALIGQGEAVHRAGVVAPAGGQHGAALRFCLGLGAVDGAVLAPSASARGRSHERACAKASGMAGKYSNRFDITVEELKVQIQADVAALLKAPPTCFECGRERGIPHTFDCPVPARDAANRK